MPRWLWKLLIGAGILIAVLLAAQLIWLDRTASGFEAQLERLRRSGQPVSPADLATPPVPEEQNAAPLLLQARAWYAAHAKQPQLWSDPSGAPEEQAAEVAAWIDRCEPYVALLKEALQRPACDFHPRWEQSPFMRLESLSITPAAE